MGLNLKYGEGQTPIDEDEKEGLKLKSIITQQELNEWEQLNIEKAIEWTIRNKFSEEKVLSESFIKNLHKRMYDAVWKWAGEYRKSEKNIGVKWVHIQIELRKLIDDTKFWIKGNQMKPEEIAIRFKHRIVSIHCFANGNGRHSRLMADIIMEHIFVKEVFTWGQSNHLEPIITRKKYIAALKKADQGDIEPLIEFAMS